MRGMLVNDEKEDETRNPTGNEERYAVGLKGAEAPRSLRRDAILVLVLITTDVIHEGDLAIVPL